MGAGPRLEAVALVGTPLDIEDALSVYLPTTALAALFGHSDEGQKFWAGAAPADPPVVLPYLVYFEVSGTYTYESPDGDNLVNAQEETEYQVSVFAATRSQARSLRRAALAALNDAPLFISDGEQYYFRGRSLGGVQLDPSLGIDGSDVWQAIAVFTCMVSHTFPSQG